MLSKLLREHKEPFNKLNIGISDTLITDSDFYTLTEALLTIRSTELYLGITMCKGVTLNSAEEMIKLCKNVKTKKFRLGIIFLEGYTWDILARIDKGFKENPNLEFGQRMNI